MFTVKNIKWFKILKGLFYFLLGSVCLIFLIGGFLVGLELGDYVNSQWMQGVTNHVRWLRDSIRWLCAFMGLGGILICEAIIVAPLEILFTLVARLKSIDEAIDGLNSLKQN